MGEIGFEWISHGDTNLLKGGVNLNGFVGNNPICRRDHFGLGWGDDLLDPFSKNQLDKQPYRLKPGQCVIGFMKKDGTLIGKFADPKIGHESLASQLGVYDLAKNGSVIAITICKGCSRENIRAFGSGMFPPPGGGPMPEYLRTLAEKLVE
ncbi:MAG: hypothetical protein JW902_16145 [Syntrophaceae bacterium]|nr:hypothetical protein [Syntrophaceae bacterium]